jgi:hypothetical protein
VSRVPSWLHFRPSPSICQLPTPSAIDDSGTKPTPTTTRAARGRINLIAYLALLRAHKPVSTYSSTTSTPWSAWPDFPTPLPATHRPTCAVRPAASRPYQHLAVEPGPRDPNDTPYALRICGSASPTIGLCHGAAVIDVGRHSASPAAAAAAAAAYHEVKPCPLSETSSLPGYNRTGTTHARATRNKTNIRIHLRVHNRSQTPLSVLGLDGSKLRLDRPVWHCTYPCHILATFLIDVAFGNTR